MLKRRSSLSSRLVIDLRWCPEPILHRICSMMRRQGLVSRTLCISRGQIIQLNYVSLSSFLKTVS